MQNDIDSIYIKKSLVVAAGDIDKLSIVKLSNLMPFLIPILKRIVKFRFFIINVLQKVLPSLTTKVDSLAALWIMNQLERVINERLEIGKKRKRFTSINVGCYKRR